MSSAGEEGNREPDFLAQVSSIVTMLTVDCPWPISRSCSAALSFAMRVCILFSAGILCSMVLNPLQIQHRVTTLSMFTWWVAPCCGAAAVFIGLAYPCADACVRQDDHAVLTDWTSVMRCLVIFLGINQASVSIPYTDDKHLAMSLGAMAIGMWFLFDRTACGLGLGISVAALATVVAQVFVFSDFYSYTHPDFLFVRSWLPSIFFSGGVTFGHLGRKLAQVGRNQQDMTVADVELVATKDKRD